MNSSSKYTTCDLILLFQIYYYRWKRNPNPAAASTDNEEERAPLLGNQVAEEEIVPVKILVLRYAAALAFVTAVGITAWWITKDNEDSDFTRPDPPKKGTKWWIIQALGWSSALLFVRMHDLAIRAVLSDSSPPTARCTSSTDMSESALLPIESSLLTPNQAKNFSTRCEGLSPALFFFAIFGNSTYALSICAKSMDKDYLITNGGWLAGRQSTFDSGIPWLTVCSLQEVHVQCFWISS